MPEVKSTGHASNIERNTKTNTAQRVKLFFKGWRIKRLMSSPFKGAGNPFVGTRRKGSDVYSITSSQVTVKRVAQPG